MFHSRSSTANAKVHEHLEVVLSKARNVLEKRASNIDHAIQSLKGQEVDSEDLVMRGTEDTVVDESLIVSNGSVSSPTGIRDSRGNLVVSLGSISLSESTVEQKGEFLDKLVNTQLYMEYMEDVLEEGQEVDVEDAEEDADEVNGVVNIDRECNNKSDETAPESLVLHQRPVRSVFTDRKLPSPEMDDVRRASAGDILESKSFRKRALTLRNSLPYVQTSGFGSTDETEEERWSPKPRDSSHGQAENFLGGFLGAEAEVKVPEKPTLRLPSGRYGMRKSLDLSLKASSQHS